MISYQMIWLYFQLFHLCSPWGWLWLCTMAGNLFAKSRIIISPIQRSLYETNYCLFQICPGTTCGKLATAGGKWVLPDETAEKQETCSAFSLGVKENSNKAANNALCTNDYISIPGTYLSNRIILSILATLHLWYICLITGASVPCCQGSNPQPIASAICGYFFNIAPDNANAGANAAICGQYNII